MRIDRSSSRAIRARALLAASLLSAAQAQAAGNDAGAWTFSAGLGSSTAWNIVAVTRDHKLGEHAALFVTAGLGEMILGAGLVYHADRDGDGWVASAVAGTGRQAALTYRVKLGAADFVTAGASYVRVFGFSDIRRPQILPILAYERRF